MPNDDEPYPPRPFKCKCGFVLGWIVRDTCHVTRLNVLRVPNANSVMPHAQSDIEMAQVWSVTDANDGDVRCLHCGAVRPWVASKSAMDEMLKRRDERKVNSESL